MPRIKICSLQLGLSPVSKLGGEIYDYQTIKGFAKKNINVFIYLPKDKPYDKSLRGIRVDFAPIKHIFPPWIFSFICLPYLFRLQKVEKFDILRIHSPRYLGMAALIFHYFYKEVPILVSAVTVDKPRILYFIEKSVYQIADKVIVQSQHMKNYLINNFRVDSSKIVITYGGMLDIKKKITQTPNESSFLRKEDKVMLFMGSLTVRKNPVFALEVFIHSKKKEPSLKLIIIGSGALKNKLINIVAENHLEKSVIFIESAYQAEKSYWFSKMDICIIPSLNEGFGLVATEAMTFGKVVLASDQAAFQEIISNGKDGYTLSLSKVEPWVNITVNLINNNKLTKKIGENAFKKVKQRFSWERAYNLNYKVIREMLS